MDGKVIIRNAKTLYITPLDVYIDAQKVGHIKNNGVGEFPISGDCEVSVQCGITPQRPKISIRGGFLTEVQFKFFPMFGVLGGIQSLKIVREERMEEALEKAKKAQEAEAWEHRERHMRCNICGNVFCYTYEDIQRNQKLAKDALMSSVLSVGEALGGTRLGSYAASADADRKQEKIVDYSKCPKCNSTNIIELTQEEVKKLNNPNPIPIAASSVVEELKKYKELLDCGVISQEEFDAKKKQLLGL